MTLNIQRIKFLSKSLHLKQDKLSGVTYQLTLSLGNVSTVIFHTESVVLIYYTSTLNHCPKTICADRNNAKQGSWAAKFRESLILF